MIEQKYTSNVGYLIPNVLKLNRIIDELFEEHVDEVKLCDCFDQNLLGKALMETRTLLRELKHGDAKTVRDDPNCMSNRDSIESDCSIGSKIRKPSQMPEASMPFLLANRCQF